MRGSSDSFLSPSGGGSGHPVKAEISSIQSEPFNSSCPGAKVWILDDDKELCKLLARQFKASGWLSLSTHSGGELDDNLGDIYPDLLVLDQMLPGKSGTEILANLRKAGHLFPVLMLSALGAPEDRIVGLETGADDYLTKPFTSRELLLRVERLLHQAKPPASIVGASADRYRIAHLIFDPSEMTLGSEENTVVLSRGEVVLLNRFCQSPGLILSREQLARDSGSLIDVNKSRSLDMRISNLRRQLNTLSPALGDQLETVRGRGYRLVADIRRISS